MPIYERFTGAHRDSFASLDDVQKYYKLHWEDNFNFAYDVIDVLGREQPDKEAMVWVSAEGEERRYSFRDMMLWSNRAANYLTSLGIGKGDAVLLVLRRSYLFWFLMLGLHKIGGIAVQATDMLMEKDYVYRCQAAKICAVAITDHGDAAERFEAFSDECPTVRRKLVGGKKQIPGWDNIEEGLAAASEEWTRPVGEACPMANDPMLISFSSGTTGYPKMIYHDFTYPLGHIMTGVFWHRVVDGGLHFTISDTGWLKSLWGKLYGQWMGESAVLVYDFERFDAADILSKLEKYRVTTFCVPPTMYRMMLQQDVRSYDLSALQHCCTAGEALNPEIFHAWKEYTGLSIYEGFGQTETPLCLATLAPWSKPLPGAIGRPVPGFDVVLLDEDGKFCPLGVTGEICIRAESTEKRPRGLLISYNGSPEDTAEKWHDGYYHTGDTAYQNDFGLFCYVGRNDDVIKSSGYRIGPFEVESVLMEHPAVLEVAVTGTPDSVRGFAVKATIVLRPDFAPSDALVKELQTYVKKNTAPYKYPRVVQFVDALPKTFNGKIRRAEIRRRDREAYEAAHKG